jgi:phosphoserine aminotransferase
MNPLRGKTKADYVNTGEWSKKAIKEGSHCDVHIAASSEDRNFVRTEELERAAGHGLRSLLLQ